MRLGQLEEELTCIVCWHCSISTGAVRWEVTPRGLQSPGTFRWWVSLSFFFSLNWWHGMGSLHTVGLKKLLYLIVPMKSVNVIYPFIHPQTLFECLPYVGCHSRFGFWLLQIVLCPWKTLCFSRPQFYLLWNERSSSGCWVFFQKQRIGAHRSLLWIKNTKVANKPGIFSKENSPQLGFKLGGLFRLNKDQASPLLF